MSTTTTLTGPEIRRILGDTRRSSPAQIEAARRAQSAFFDLKPPRGWQCVVDSCMIPAPGERDDGTQVWVCEKCHRPCSFTREERQAEVERERQKETREAEKEKARRAKAGPEPTPRAALRESIADREACSARITSLQSGLNAARSRVTDAESLVASATDALTTAEAQAVEHEINVVTGAINGKTKTPLATAARATLADAESALTLAKTTRDTIRERLAQAESHLEAAKSRVATAAMNVLRAEGVAVSAALVEEIEAVWVKVPLLQWLVSQRATIGVAPHSPAWTLLSNLPPGRSSDEVSEWKAALQALQQDAGTKLPSI